MRRKIRWSRSNSAFVIISILTFLCYLPDLANDLLNFWDDAGYILENVYIRHISVETVSWAFTTFWCNFWAPLTWLSLALDYAIWGLNPIGYHLSNNILHALNAGMFFYLSQELLASHFRRRRPQNSELSSHDESLAFWGALLAAFFFALQPLRVESVVWATERKDVLSLFFGIPAVYAYTRYAKACQPEAGSISTGFIFSSYYWLTFVFFCLSLLSKPMLVTFPAVLLILDWFPLERIRTTGMRRIIAEKVLFTVMSAIVAIISMKAQKPQLMPLEQADIFSRILNAAKSITSYLWMTVWPRDISPFYLHPGNIPILDFEYDLPVLFVIAVTIGCAALARRKPFFVAVWLLYLATLFPVLGFTQVGPQAMAARFTYAPSLPISLFIGVMFASIIFRRPESRLIATLASVVAGCLLLFYSYVTVCHIAFWRDDVTLWTRVVDLNPRGSGRAYFQLSHAHEMRGEYHLALADINKALDIAKQKKYRAMYELYQVRARILGYLGDYSGAIANYDCALESAGEQEKAMLYQARGELLKRVGAYTRVADDLVSSGK